MFELGLVLQFEAAHHLKGEFGPAQQLHGHTYRVEISAEGGRLRADGTLLDFGWLDRQAREVVEGLHYRSLNDLPAFREENSTVERVAEHIGQAMAERLRGKGLLRVRVRVWESPQVFGAYSVALEAGG